MRVLPVGTDQAAALFSRNRDPSREQIIEHMLPLRDLPADPPRHAAAMADWHRQREGTALGVAFAKYGVETFGHALTAAVAEISVDEGSGRIRVHAFWIAVDPGLPLQPDNIVAQVESTVIYALGGALSERITIREGRVQQSNFRDYQVMRMADVPPIQIEVLRGGDRPQQVGEIGVPTVAPAIANAFFAFTGRRLRHLPMAPAVVLEALRA